MSDIFGELEGQLRIGTRQATIGARRIALLEQIDATGSISAAARALGLSYKGAWDAVNALNNLADAPLVTRATGGAGGGGSVLSARARQMVHIYRAAEQEQHRFLARLNRRVSYVQDDIDLIGRLGMTSSARNQLTGEVRRLELGSVNAEAEIALRGGETLTAVITRTSAENLGLTRGAPVTALIKASWVMVAAGDATHSLLSARNQLAGTVETVTRNEVNGEIVIRLPGGNTLVAVVTRESADALDLSSGDTATAIFKASSVILAQAD